MMTVHSVTRGWQDICVLLGMMGYMQPPIPCLMEGCPVTSSIHVVPSFIKNLPQKGAGAGAVGEAARKCRVNLLSAPRCFIGFPPYLRCGFPSHPDACRPRPCHGHRPMAPSACPALPRCWQGEAE